MITFFLSPNYSFNLLSLHFLKEIYFFMQSFCKTRKDFLYTKDSKMYWMLGINVTCFCLLICLNFKSKITLYSRIFELIMNGIFLKMKYIIEKQTFDTNKENLSCYQTNLFLLQLTHLSGFYPMFIIPEGLSWSNLN